MNLTYFGSIAERDMNFASSVDVVVDEKNELFNAVSIYVPASLALANIVDYNPAWITAERPAVFTCVVSNYKEIMKGKLLDQWQDVFRQDTNVSAMLYVIIFLDDESTAGMWDIDDISIKFKPLTEAFKKLSFISFVKVLFNENYDGRPELLPPSPGKTASAQIQLANSTSGDIEIPAGNYVLSDGVKTWTMLLVQPLIIASVGADNMLIFADDIGDDAQLPLGSFDAAEITPALPDGLAVNVLSFVQGANAGTEPAEQQSKFFDFSLALAYLCKQNLKLSYFVSMVKVSYVDQKPNPDDVCHIRLKTSAEEKEAMLSIKDNDRAKYYWGALVLMGCTLNTWTLIHSEPVNIIPLIFAGWFAEKNSSGQFVGNKLSRLRLKGVKIKPLGFPSWINSEINENDAKGIDLLQAKNIGFLRTISDNTPQESCIDSARSVDGTPVAALMISKFVDYASAQACAKLLTETATVTRPILTNKQAYKRVQEIVFSNLLLFVPTGRVSNIQLKFPPFSVAKVGLRELVATGSWSASYTDDLDKVTVTGGITAA
jgi:hypothetical protein